MTTDARSVALRFHDAINARDLDALVALMADDHRFVDSAGTVLSGRSAVSAAWTGFFEAFPDYRNEIESAEVRGGSVVMAGRSVCSVPELDGPALWTAAVQGSLVREWRVYTDDAETRASLGIPTP